MSRISVFVLDTNQQCSEQRLSPERKPVIMRRKHVSFVDRMWVENPTTIQTRISKETKRFSRMVISSSAVDLFGTLPAYNNRLRQKEQSSVSSTSIEFLLSTSFGYLPLAY